MTPGKGRAEASAFIALVEDAFWALIGSELAVMSRFHPGVTASSEEPDEGGTESFCSKEEKLLLSGGLH